MLSIISLSRLYNEKPAHNIVCRFRALSGMVMCLEYDHLAGGMLADLDHVDAGGECLIVGVRECLNHASRHVVHPHRLALGAFFIYCQPSD